MKLTIICKELLRGLTQASSCVESRLALPILSTVLFRLDGNMLSLTATNLEVEVTSRTQVEDAADFIPIAVAVRKLLDTCKNLPPDAVLTMAIQNNKASVSAGRGCYNFAMLPAEEFPLMDDEAAEVEFSIEQNQLKYLFERTQFAVAQQDVRFFLNGLLWEISGNAFAAAGADGHRMAYASIKLGELNLTKQRVIVPRDAIHELSRLLESTDSTVDIKISSGHVSVAGDNFVFRTKLIESTFPEYHVLLKVLAPNSFVANKNELKQILTRSAIFTSDQFHTIRVNLSQNLMQVVAKNAALEESSEELEIEYQGDAISLGFNVKYLLDCLAIVDSDKVKFSFSDGERNVFIGALNPEDSIYSVMPIRL